MTYLPPAVSSHVLLLVARESRGSSGVLRLRPLDRKADTAPTSLMHAKYTEIARDRRLIRRNGTCVSRTVRRRATQAHGHARRGAECLR